MLFITGNALGFSTGSGNVIPFSVDYSDFRVESNTTIKIFITHDILIKEMNNVIKRSILFEILSSS